MSSHSGGAVVRLSSEASGRSRAKPGDYRSGFGAVDEARAFLGHLAISCRAHNGTYGWSVSPVSSDQCPGREYKE